jgi:hypothetical protein
MISRSWAGKQEGQDVESSPSPKAQGRGHFAQRATWESSPQDRPRLMQSAMRSPVLRTIVIF